MRQQTEPERSPNLCALLRGADLLGVMNSFFLCQHVRMPALLLQALCEPNLNAMGK
jgi:hypothetical protein